MKTSFAIFLALPLMLCALSDSDFLKLQRTLRQIDANDVKLNVTSFDSKKALPNQKTNGDEQRYEDLRGSFGKGLDHLATGFVNQIAFKSLIKALGTGSQSSFNQIILGIGTRLLANPQGSYAYSLSSNDGWINSMPAAPQFASAEAAAEMVELYWTALVRDVNFNDFSTDPTVALAVANLSTLTDFTGPKVNGQVTAGTFLRGNAAGDLIGPYISQFLYQTIPYGNTSIGPTGQVPVSGTGNDFITTFIDYYTVISGGLTGDAITFDATARFIRTPRDLTEYVHQDTPGQAALSALLLLNSYGSAALDTNNPYLSNPTQDGFVSYGISQVLELLRDAVQEALKTAWYEKWQVNRRCRPEEFGFNVQQQIVGGQDLGINDQLINSPALTSPSGIFATYGSYFLPQAYPEGSPMHPSYPAGHATLMGAAVTILKAFFNEDFTIPSPLEPNAANTLLVAYGGTLKVGDELNKLASNIALGRDHAGVHYRSDGTQGLLLGEKVAIDILNNSSFLFNENFPGFNLTKFDGTQILVGGKRNTP
ncbi:MAG: vanadium-dependent haloperoxidase [Chlamydiales bacterium]|nr:vanadium-dependent haloperoxidase [Chlamydiales bacterium]